MGHIRNNWRRLVWGVLIFCAVSLLVYVHNIPGTLVAQMSPGESEITVHTDRRAVLLDGGCVLFSWDAQNIQAIYLDGQGTVGEGSAEVCVSAGELPTLDVVLQDGEEVRIDVPIEILVHQRWFLVAIGTLLLLPLVLLLTYVPRTENNAQLILNYTHALTLITASITITFILLEVAVRAYFSLFGAEEDRIAYIYSPFRIRQLTSQTNPMPYLNYGLEPNYPGHNTLGYRGEDFSAEKPSDEFRFIALGGSTTYGIGLAPEQAYPAQLAQILQEDYGHAHVYGINGGVIGYTTWNSVTNFAFRALELDVDMVIIYHSINDISVRNMPVDCYQGEHAALGLGATTTYGTTQPQTGPSALYRFVAIQIGYMPNPSTLTSQQMQVVPCEQDNLGWEEHLQLNTPDYFERNLRTIIAIAQAHNVQPVLSTWVHYEDAPLQNMTQEQKDAVLEHNDIIRGLGEALDVPVMDLTETDMSQQRSFFFSDGVHQREDGMRLQAEFYARYLTENNLIPPP